MLVNRRIRRFGLVAALVVALMAVGLGPAAADPPLKSNLAIAIDDADCGGGLTYDLAATGTEIVRFRTDGTVSVFQNWHGTVTGSNGKTLRLHHAFTMTFAPDGTLTITGLPFGAWDGGDSILDRGIVVIDGGGLIKLAGPHPAGPDPHPPTCALLAA